MKAHNAVLFPNHRCKNLSAPTSSILGFPQFLKNNKWNVTVYLFPYFVDKLKLYASYNMCYHIYIDL